MARPSVVDGPHVAARAFTYTLGQWPATVTIAGIAALLVSLTPRMPWLGRLPLVASSVLVLLGHLLGVPRRVNDLGLFRHVPDVAGGNHDLDGLVALLAVAAAAAFLALVAITRRDVVAG